MIALACAGPAGASTASTADQPGVTSPSQPGTATPPPPPAPPPPAPEPAPEPQPVY
ncbi:dihydrolipoamide succinyltransferase, partial [Nocardia nova]|nr:dihydrolipoamide succinyltransferase [Nocardia nova]